MIKSGAAIRIELPEDERGLNDAQIRRVDKLLRRLDDTTLPKPKREAARDELRAVEDGRALSREQDALNAHLAQVEKLERARDPEASEVVETAKSGRKRILTRDGLESLLMVQSISPLQYAAGMRYRDLYESTERSIRSNLNRTLSGAEDKRPMSEVGQQMQARKRLEAKVQDASKNGRGLQTLRLIAGEGRALRALVPSGGSANAERYAEALRVALDVCADHWGMQ